MEQKENIYVEEQGANFLDVLKVLFGRPLLLLIITFGVAFVGTAGTFLYNSFTKTYDIVLCLLKEVWLHATSYMWVTG